MSSNDIKTLIKIKYKDFRKKYGNKKMPVHIIIPENALIYYERAQKVKKEFDKFIYYYIGLNVLYRSLVRRDKSESEKIAIGEFNKKFSKSGKKYYRDIMKAFKSITDDEINFLNAYTPLEKKGLKNYGTQLKTLSENEDKIEALLNKYFDGIRNQRNMIFHGGIRYQSRKALRVVNVFNKISKKILLIFIIWYLENIKRNDVKTYMPWRS
ncbi:MAG: hypothetical protein QXI58_08290 [Candidatus Micrarchaeia archaeon]